MTDSDTTQEPSDDKTPYDEKTPESPEVMEEPDTSEDASAGSVSQPAKVMRIGSMVRQLLEEVRSTELDEKGRERLGEIYDTSIGELTSALSPDLQAELDNLTSLFGDGDVPTESELRIAQAQLVGWLEGLFHGIQATLFAQQMAARQQLEGIGHPQGALSQGSPPAAAPPQAGVYL